jgi:hypothetical protein
MALAAKCGSVYFFDPQPYCAQSIATAVIKNNFARAYLVPYPVSDVEGKKVTLDRKYNCNGRWPIQQDENGISLTFLHIMHRLSLASSRFLFYSRGFGGDRHGGV